MSSRPHNDNPTSDFEGRDALVTGAGSARVALPAAAGRDVAGDSRFR